MTRIEEIENTVASLPGKEYRQFREWFLKRGWAQWDKQIQADSDSGKWSLTLGYLPRITGYHIFMLLYGKKEKQCYGARKHHRFSHPTGWRRCNRYP